MKIVAMEGDSEAVIPLFQRAIQLDPNFAMAYWGLAASYINLGERTLTTENSQKAYELREPVSEVEKFRIESYYFEFVTGDLEKARQVDELWARSYPRDPSARNLLSIVYRILGQNDKMLAATLEAARLNPPPLTLEFAWSSPISF
jgi:tetratricopeptide (TPR) repeat protein